MGLGGSPGGGFGDDGGGFAGAGVVAGWLLPALGGLPELDVGGFPGLDGGMGMLVCLSA